MTRPRDPRPAAAARFPRKVVARVKAILKHSNGLSAPKHRQRAILSLDLVSRQCRVGPQEVALTATEFAILSSFWPIRRGFCRVRR